MRPGTKVAGGIVGACALGVLVLLVALGIRHQSGGTLDRKDELRQTVRSSYPPPTSKRNGWTADHYAEAAKDGEYFTCQEACAALHYYKAEGVPFLLAALRYHANHDPESGMVGVPIAYLDGRYVRQEDLALLLPYLASKYKPPEGRQEGIRSNVVGIFRMAKNNGRPYLPQLRELLDEPALGAQFHALLETAIKEIEE